jgi:NAD-dependent dihydropyrimidine dehydrogenase PreA subunit
VGWFEPDRQKYRNLASAWVVPAPARCVQCGVCSFHCPMEIDVRRYAWLGEPVHDSHCLTCGECVERCPRGLLRFLPIGPAMPVQQPSEVRDEQETAGRRTGERDDELDPTRAAR